MERHREGSHIDTKKSFSTPKKYDEDEQTHSCPYRLDVKVTQGEFMLIPALKSR